MFLLAFVHVQNNSAANKNSLQAKTPCDNTILIFSLNIFHKSQNKFYVSVSLDSETIDETLKPEFERIPQTEPKYCFLKFKISDNK